MEEIAIIGLLFLVIHPFARGPISRELLTWFADHRGITITLDNGDTVIRRLLAAKRMLVLGVGAGLLVTTLTGDFFYILVGCLLGAVGGLRVWDPRAVLGIAAATSAWALLIGVQALAPEDRLPYTMDVSYPAANLAPIPQSVGGTDAPECLGIDERDGCKAWELLAGKERILFPQAAPYTMTTAIRPAPLALSRDGHWVVYLDKQTRRMVHRDLRTTDTRYLTGPLTDRDVPTAAISPEGRFVTLGNRLVDTRTLETVELPGIVRVIDVASSGVVGATGPLTRDPATMTELVVFDQRGGERMRVPFDASHYAWLHPDGHTLLAIDSFGTHAVTYDVRTGKVRHDVDIRLPAADMAESGIGRWTADGRFVITRDDREQEFFLDPATGRTTRVR